MSGSSAKLSAVLCATPSYKHHLEAFVYRHQVGIICVVCGAHSSFKVDLLAYSCLRSAAGRKGKEGLRRYERGLHPNPRNEGLLEGSWPIPDPAAD